MNILFLDPIVHTAGTEKYKYYNGLFDSLSKVENINVALFSGIFEDLNVFIDKVNFKPDVIIFGLGWFNHKFFKKIKNLNIPSICLLFKPQNELNEKLFFCKENNINLILTPIPGFKQYEEITGIKTKLFTYGFDPTNFKKRDIKKIYDIGFSGALHKSNIYPSGSFKTKDIRVKIGNILNLIDRNIFWNSSDNTNTAYIDNYKEYAKTINSSKMWIATQAAFGDITPRFFEVLGSGTVLFCQKIPKEYSNVLINDVNCIEFNDDLSNFTNKLEYYLNSEELLNKISNNALEFSHNNLTWDHKAKEIIRLIKEIL